MIIYAIDVILHAIDVDALLPIPTRRFRCPCHPRYIDVFFDDAAFADIDTITLLPMRDAADFTPRRDARYAPRCCCIRERAMRKMRRVYMSYHHHRYAASRVFFCMVEGAVAGVTPTHDFRAAF